MSPTLKSLHRRLAWILPTLFLTAIAGLVAWADDTTPAAPATTPSAPVTDATSTPVATPTVTPALPHSGPVVMPPTAAPAPGTSLPATGGSIEQDVNKPTPENKPAAADPTKAANADTPLEMPVVKPITFDSDRDAEIGHVVGELLEQNHYLQRPINP